MADPKNGAEIRFYHLQRKSLEDALPQLLLKALEKDMRTLIQTNGGEDRALYLDEHLWTWSDRIFIPHGSARDGEAEHQPIWVTDKEENPNGSNVLILVDGAWRDAFDGFSLCCNLFNGLDDEALAAAREQWKTAKDKGYRLTYWQQNDQGGWDLKKEENAVSG